MRLIDAIKKTFANKRFGDCAPAPTTPEQSGRWPMDDIGIPVQALGDTVFELSAEEHAQPLRRCYCCGRFKPQREILYVCRPCFVATPVEPPHR
jgi:hypothetical protein